LVLVVLPPLGPLHTHRPPGRPKTGVGGAGARACR
jgi:hypothetical protein